MNNNGNEDKRPDPKPRKHPQLWQSYLFYDELVEMRKRHNLRISSIKKGKSNMDAQLEYEFLEQLNPDPLIKYAKKTIVNYGKLVKAWEWATSIRGLGDGVMVAQLLAQIDDIAKFDTISKLWRFSGLASIDGKKEFGTKHFNRHIKSLCYNIGKSFIWQQTPDYVEIYYADKERLRRLYPEPTPNPDKNSPWPLVHTDSHIHRMARHKMVKIFIAHLWLVWRDLEGLPVSKPYVEQILGHDNIIPPSPPSE